MKNKNLYLQVNYHKMKKCFIIVVLLISGIFSTARQQEVPYTLADRDRLIQFEANVNGLSNEMNANFNSIYARFDVILKKFDYVIWMLCLIIVLQLITIGYLIWNRLITVPKIINDIEELKRTNEKMKLIFIKQSESQPGLTEILKNAGIL